MFLDNSALQLNMPPLTSRYFQFDSITTRRWARYMRAHVAMRYVLLPSMSFCCCLDFFGCHFRRIPLPQHKCEAQVTACHPFQCTHHHISQTPLFCHPYFPLSTTLLQNPSFAKEICDVISMC